MNMEEHMEEKKTSLLSNGMIWFGAAVSIAEILTGMLIAPLGLHQGVCAVIVGHLIGCLLLYMAGLIGGKTGKSAMETVKISFGGKGALLFSTLNVLQLVGWTAVMITSGAVAASSVISNGGVRGWSLIIGGLILLWILVGLKNLSKINVVAMGALLVLTMLLSAVIFHNPAAPVIDPGGISFGAAVELSVAMPLSWLPLISDYTRQAEKPKKATAVSVVVYFGASCWMYLIGMAAARFTGESDIAAIMMRAGLGTAALIIIIFSTVTTTFLDVYSAGVSSQSICSSWKEKPAAVVVCAAGTLLAMFTPASEFENFLYLIGSVFAPMIAILIADFFILKKDCSKKAVCLSNLLIWVVGFLGYRMFMYMDTPVGNTLPVMVLIIVLCVAADQRKGASPGCWQQGEFVLKLWVHIDLGRCRNTWK